MSQKPNIVFILTDDLGYADLGCQNPDSKIPTPNLDRLASQGARFTDAHAPHAVCTPTRYSVLTGRFCWRTHLKKGVLQGNSPPLIEDGRLTVGQMLQSQGYATACVGKWHLGASFHLKDENEKVSVQNIDWDKPFTNGPIQQGFDYHYGIGKPGWTFMENDRVLEAPTEEFDLGHIGPYLIGGNNIRGYKGPSYQHEQMLPNFTKKATEFIDRSASENKPFFLYYTPIAPHKPIVPNKEFIGKSQAGVYGDFVCELDHRVGEILDALDRNGVADNTLVIFTSDNGPENIAYDRIQEYQHYSMGELRGLKRDAWEGGHRVPFLARWPGKIAPNTINDEVICLVDFMATVAEILDYDLPNDAAEDSLNILPVLLGENHESPYREATVHYSSKGTHAIRKGDWVFIDAESGDNNSEPDWFREERGAQPHDHPGELYNLAEDLSQRHNQYGEHPPDIVDQLKSILERYKTSGRSVPERR